MNFTEAVREGDHFTFNHSIYKKVKLEVELFEPAKNFYVFVNLRFCPVSSERKRISTDDLIQDFEFEIQYPKGTKINIFVMNSSGESANIEKIKYVYFL